MVLFCNKYAKKVADGNSMQFTLINKKDTESSMTYFRKKMPCPSNT